MAFDINALVWKYDLVVDWAILQWYMKSVFTEDKMLLSLRLVGRCATLIFAKHGKIRISFYKVNEHSLGFSFLKRKKFSLSQTFRPGQVQVQALSRPTPWQHSLRVFNFLTWKSMDMVNMASKIHFWGQIWFMVRFKIRPGYRITQLANMRRTTSMSSKFCNGRAVAFLPQILSGQWQSSTGLGRNLSRSI